MLPIISIKVINDYILNLIMLIESGIALKAMLVLIYARILHHSFVPTIYENFKPVFLLT